MWGYFTACPCGIVDSARKFAAFLRDVTVYQRELRLLMIFFEILIAVSTLFQRLPPRHACLSLKASTHHTHPCATLPHTQLPGVFARVYQNHPVITARVLAVGGVGGVWLRNRCPGVNVR